MELFCRLLPSPYFSLCLPALDVYPCFQMFSLVPPLCFYMPTHFVPRTDTFPNAKNNTTNNNIRSHQEGRETGKHHEPRAMQRIEPVESPPRLVPAAVAVFIDNPRHAQSALRVANQIYPFDSACEHLKRIRRHVDTGPSATQTPRLELLLVVRGAGDHADEFGMPPSSTPSSPEDSAQATLATQLLGEAYASFVTSLAEACGAPASSSTNSDDVAGALATSLAPHLVQVASVAPRQSPEAWETWNAVWPLALPKPHPPGLIPPTVVSQALAVVSAHLLPLMSRCTVASDAAAATWFPPRSCPARAALVWDPRTETVLASSEAYVASSHRTAAHTGLLAEHPVMFALKQLAQRQASRHAPRQDGAKGDAETRAADSTPQRPYLANGLDLFVSHEPCVMCAMALIHSRIERVFFLHRNTVHGGLGTCFHVHAIPSLNHHFDAFYIPPDAGTPSA